MEPYWNTIEQIIRESDIVLEILDARLIEMSRNSKLEELIKKAGRPRIFVINKVDLVADKRKLELGVERLRREDEVVYVTVKNRKTIKILLARIKEVFRKYGKRKNFIENPLIKKPYREARGDIIIGVVGYPNVGKSTIINSLAFKKKMKVSKIAGTTHGVHWISAGEKIKLIDTPGVIPLEKTDEARLALIAARNPEKLKDPELVAFKIIDMFAKEGKLERIEKFYNINLEGEADASKIIEKIAMHRHFLKKGGIPDDVRASILVVNDWQEGRLKL